MKSLDIPIEYIDYRKFKPSVRSCLERSIPKAVFKLTINNVQRNFRAKPKRLTMECVDYSGETVFISFFGPSVFAPEVKDSTQGSEIIVEGSPGAWDSQIQIRNPVIIDREMVGRVIPVYKSKKGMGKRAATIAEIRDELDSRIYGISQMILDSSNLKEHQILSAIGSNSNRLTDFLFSLHNPESVEEGDALRNQANKLAALLIAAQAYRPPRPDIPDSEIKITQHDLDDVVSRLPLQLTGDQKTAISEIVSDLRSSRPARRLLSGDVGTGKTLPIIITALAAQRVGAKVVIMVPNEPLVEQVAREITDVFPETDLLSVTGRARRTAITGNPILIGTTALVHRLKADPHWTPDYLVIDEQHKQSTNARSALVGPHTNVLEATATAIPRTTALAIYGDMDLSILRESPVVKKVTSHLLGPADKRRVLDCIARVIEAGYQAAVVYPLVEADADKNPKSSVMQTLDEWEKHFPGKVLYIHGKMKPADKIAAIKEFKENKKSLIAASSIIEVGLTAVNLRILLVVSPERYGVAQLHQLRGRLARKGGAGLFFMMLDNPNVGQETIDRLNLLVKFSDGFTLAEHDAEMRGFGDLSENGENQHGDSKGIFRGVRLSPTEVVKAIELYNGLKSS
jgi:ATP-dependent DNA helicase RecG